MDILNIGRESTYRRIRGDIPFTFDEIAKISAELNISVDDIIKKNTRSNGYPHNIQQKNMPNSEDYFFANHLTHYNLFESINNAKEAEVFISLNRLFSFFVADFSALFKFYYYRWMHTCGNVSSNFPFSKIELPEHIASFQQKISMKISPLKNVTFIFDRYIIARLIRELQYYYSRNLISDEELQEIKTDLIGFLNFIENRFQSEKNATGSTYHFYLSFLDIDANSIYGILDENVISHCYVCGKMPINLGSEYLINLHKNWMHSLRRKSMLISQSNEIIQASFLNEQYENINKITNDLNLYYG